MIQSISQEKKINVSTKSNELLWVLTENFKENINLARIRLICHFISALCKVQTVTFDKLARAFDSSAKEAFSLRRIQRFMANYVLSPDLISFYFCHILSEKLFVF